MENISVSDALAFFGSMFFVFAFLELFHLIKSAKKMKFDDRMHAGRFRPILKESAFFHLKLGYTKLKLKQKIVITRDVILVDISKWQAAVDFVKMKLAGARGVILKAGQGTAPDPMFVINWALAKLAGLKRGTYWYYDSRIHPREQARLWWSLIKDDTGELMHFADYEESYGGRYAGPQWFKVFLEEFMAVSTIPVQRIGIYTGYYYWIANSPTNLTELNWFARFKLWLAWYTTNPEVVRVPKPWSELILWQFTSSGYGAKYGVSSKEIDLNYFNGTSEQYESMFGGGTTPPEGEPSMKYQVVWPQGVARRSRPTTSNSYTGLVFDVNAVVDVVRDGIADETDPMNGNKKWVEFSDGLFGASEYPDSTGIPRTRMVKVAEPTPSGIVKAVIFKDDGTSEELYPASQ